jgi:hypothetical protein
VATLHLHGKSPSEYYSKVSTVSLQSVTISCTDNLGFAVGEFGISGKIPPA